MGNRSINHSWLCDNIHAIVDIHPCPCMYIVINTEYKALYPTLLDLDVDILGHAVTSREIIWIYCIGDTYNGNIKCTS